MSKYKNRASIPTNFEGFINARVPQDVCVFFDDFLGPSMSIEPASDMITDGTSPCGPWCYTAVAGGATVDIIDGAYNYLSTLHGVLRVTTVATADDGLNAQVGGTCFAIDQDCGLPLYFECRFRTSDVSNTDIFIGLADIDSEIITTGADDCVGFLLKSGTLYCHTAETSKEYSVDTGITEADGAASSNTGWLRCAFFFDGANTVTFMVDDDNDGVFEFETSVNVGTTLHYLPDDEALTPTIEVITGTTASAGVADIDYVYCAQQRYHA